MLDFGLINVCILSSHSVLTRVFKSLHCLKTWKNQAILSGSVRKRLRIIHSLDYRLQSVAFLLTLYISFSVIFSHSMFFASSCAGSFPWHIGLSKTAGKMRKSGGICKSLVGKPRKVLERFFLKEF